MDGDDYQQLRIMNENLQGIKEGLKEIVNAIVDLDTTIHNKLKTLGV